MIIKSKVATLALSALFALGLSAHVNVALGEDRTDARQEKALKDAVREIIRNEKDVSALLEALEEDAFKKKCVNKDKTELSEWCRIKLQRLRK